MPDSSFSAVYALIFVSTHTESREGVSDAPAVYALIFMSTYTEPHQPRADHAAVYALIFMSTYAIELHRFFELRLCMPSF